MSDERINITAECIYGYKTLDIPFEFLLEETTNFFEKINREISPAELIEFKTEDCLCLYINGEYHSKEDFSQEIEEYYDRMNILLGDYCLLRVYKEAEGFVLNIIRDDYNVFIINLTEPLDHTLWLAERKDNEPE